MLAAEYLEKLFADSFKRELDQDENVVRSLPFFATALALTVTLLGFSVHSLPSPHGDPWSYRTVTLAVVSVLLLGVVWTFSGVLRHLFIAIRARTYIIPPPESELKAWEAELRTFHTASGLTGSSLEAAIVADLREFMIDEYAKAAINNRANNIKKMFARTQALSRLVMALGLAFAIAVVIFVDGRITSYVAQLPGGHDAHTSATFEPNGLAAGQGQPPEPAARGQAASAAEPIPDRGRPPPVGEGSQPEGQPGTAQMSSEKPASNGPTAPSSNPPAPPKPQPPSSQTYERSAPPIQTR